MDKSQLVRDYLGQQHMMQLGTVKDGQPWVCTVYFVFDDSNNLYWASLPTRRHSQELRANPRVGAAIAVRYENGQPVVGIQIEGEAVQLEPAEYDLAMVQAYARRFGRDESWVKEFSDGQTEHRFYKLTPTRLYLFDEVNFPGGQRQDVI